MICALVGCMSVYVNCPTCGQAYVLTEEEAARYAGQSIECSQCNESFPVVDPSAKKKSPPPVPPIEHPRVEMTAGACAPTAPGPPPLPGTSAMSPIAPVWPHGRQAAPSFAAARPYVGAMPAPMTSAKEHARCAVPTTSAPSARA